MTRPQFGLVYTSCLCIVHNIAVVAQALSLPVPAAATVLAVYAASVALPLLAVTVAIGLGFDVAAGQLVGFGARLKLGAGAVLILAGIGQTIRTIAPNTLPVLPVL